MHVCLRSLRGELEFAQALFFERVREATDSRRLQPQEDQVEGDVVEGVAAELAVPAGWSYSRRLAACKDTSKAKLGLSRCSRLWEHKWRRPAARDYPRSGN